MTELQVGGEFDVRNLLAGGERAARWVKVLDQSRCIGCHACTTACKSENLVPVGVTRTYVKAVEVGTFPQVRRNFQVTRCNQCEDAPCVAACPTGAMFRRPDGIVDFDKRVCIGCKACMAACPYDAIFINPADHSAEKCNFCSHRIDAGLEPACVVVCPVEAILVGDLNDPSSRVAAVVNRDSVTVRRPEKETRPKVFYRDATHATLDPLAARRPDGGLFMWSEQGEVPHRVTSGAPDGWNSSAAALLAYDVPHRAPWDWRVSLYTWTKGISAGAYLAAAILALAGAIGWGDSLWLTWAPLVALGMLAATGAILIADLEHPLRFPLIFLRPQWRSWLVRGAFVIGGYGTVLAVHLLGGSLGGSEGLAKWLAVAGIPLAAATAAYTAYLFAQAKARDLWQSPLLPPHMLVQALLLGAAVLLPFGHGTHDLQWILGGAAFAHVLLVLGEITLTHPTAHAHLAVRELTRGRYAAFFWGGLVLAAVAIAAPLIGVAAVGPALLAVLLHEHAYVQSGQAVPLA
ncbi:MAG TPA: 4Fe-4S dicluster domain-containing protein [Gaiellaceae bacterium]|nr:4Fe-4S dicluster domain-containing protein [Gaiellaceae bacterium]